MISSFSIHWQIVLYWKFLVWHGYYFPPYIYCIVHHQLYTSFYSQQRAFAVQVFELHRLIKVRAAIQFM